jgi:hypothetical protein
MLVAGGLQALSAIQQGNQAQAAANYNAQVLENQAQTERNQATVRQEAQRREARQVIGQQLAATSESGAGLSGSNLDLLTESLRNSELDALNIRYQSELNAQGLQQQAGLERFQGKQAKYQSRMSAAGSLLNASGSYFGAGNKLPGFSGGQSPAPIVDRSFR